MRLRTWLLAAAFAGGCAGGTVDAGDDDGSEQTAAISTSILYEYVTPTDPTATNPLALRRANAVPSTFNPTYGAATLPNVDLAGDAKTTQAALDAIFDLPYAGNGGSAVALFGTRDATASLGTPTVDVVELYVPSQPVALSAVAQKSALYQLLPAGGGKVTVRLVNEKDYAAAAPTFDYAATVDPAAAATAVQAGAFFTGSVDVKCTKFLFWTSCKPPTGVHVTAYFSAR